MKNLKIFVVDDDAYYINILQQYLHNLGIENVKTFGSGIDCLLKINEKPDVIFLDFHMEILSGFEVLKNIKRYDSNLNVVIVSGQVDLKAAIDSLKHGAFDYLQKGDDEFDKIESILMTINETQELAKKNKRTFFKKLFSY